MWWRDAWKRSKQTMSRIITNWTRLGRKTEFLRYRSNATKRWLKRQRRRLEISFIMTGSALLILFFSNSIIKNRRHLVTTFNFHPNHHQRWLYSIPSKSSRWLEVIKVNALEASCTFQTTISKSMIIKLVVVPACSWERVWIVICWSLHGKTKIILRWSFSI